MTLLKAEEFSEALRKVIQNDPEFKGLLVSVKTVDQDFGSCGCANTVVFEVKVLINGVVTDLKNSVGE